MNSSLSQTKRCLNSQCNRKAITNGFCDMHYRRWRKHGDSDIIAKPPTKKRIYSGCSVKNCDNNHHANGYCAKHYARYKRYGSPLAGVRPFYKDVECELEDCHLPAKVKHLCSKHYERWRKYGDTSQIKKKYRRDYDRKINRYGYVEIYRPDHPNAMPSTGWALEHRIIMSDHLNRPLLEDENVHHRNGNRTDNRIENLELWCSSQPSGQRPIDLVNWAEMILDRYKLEVTHVA
jgi:hypothetical protein